MLHRSLTLQPPMPQNPLPVLPPLRAPPECLVLGKCVGYWGAAKGIVECASRNGCIQESYWFFCESLLLLVFYVVGIFMGSWLVYILSLSIIKHPDNKRINYKAQKNNSYPFINIVYIWSLAAISLLLGTPLSNRAKLKHEDPEPGESPDTTSCYIYVISPKVIILFNKIKWYGNDQQMNSWSLFLRLL